MSDGGKIVLILRTYTETLALVHVFQFILFDIPVQQ